MSERQQQRVKDAFFGSVTSEELQTFITESFGSIMFKHNSLLDDAIKDMYLGNEKEFFLKTLLNTIVKYKQSISQCLTFIDKLSKIQKRIERHSFKELVDANSYEYNVITEFYNELLKNENKELTEIEKNTIELYSATLDKFIKINKGRLNYIKLKLNTQYSQTNKNIYINKFNRK